MREHSLRANYDDIADVLYVTVGTGRPDRYEEDAQGLIWRVNTAGTLYGVTILDYAEAWKPEREKLARRIADRLRVARSEAERALKSV